MKVSISRNFQRNVNLCCNFTKFVSIFCEIATWIFFSWHQLWILFLFVDAAVEDDEGPKLTKKVEKTTWDWILVNNAKPIWTRKPNEIEVAEYNDFYKSITKDTNGPMAYTHFIAEGEVTFKSLLFVPVNQKSEEFQKYGNQDEQIKLYVRRVFITNDFKGQFHDFFKKKK